MSDVTLPNTIATGQQRSATKIQQNDEALRDFVNGTGWVETDKLAALAVTDAKIASANNSVYKTLLTAEGSMSSDMVAGTYAFIPGRSAMLASPVSIATTPIVARYLDDADFTVASLTTKLRVRLTVSTNGTVPALTFTAGLYPVTFSGAADVLTATLGAVVASSTAAIASPAANGTTVAVSSDVNVPADGLYAFGVVTSATLTNNAAVFLTAQLQTRNT